MTNFGKIIKQERDKAGLSQLELANLLEIRPETICRWETGRTSPNVKQYERALKILSKRKPA